MPDLTQPKRRIEFGGGNYMEMELPAGSKGTVEQYTPDPMFGGQPTSYKSFPGGGSMEMQSQPQGAPEAQLMPGDIPPGLQSRDRYEKFLQSKYGDPWEDERNLSKTVDKTARENERQLFDHVFRGKYRYEDRRYLSKKALDYWQDSLLKLRKNIETQSKQDITTRKDQLGDQMKTFDSYIKELKPTKPKEITAGDYSTVRNMIQKAMYDSKGNMIEPDPIQSQLIIKAAEKLGMPIEEVTLPAERNWFGDIGEPNIPAMKTLQIGKSEARKEGETVEQWRKRTGR